MIESSEISVVMQGPISPANLDAIADNIAQVKHALPRCELIVITWKGSDIKHRLSRVDQFLELEDPGTTTIGWDSKSNIDRQLASVLGGLRVASRSYAIRMRLDTTLASDRFLQSYAALLADTSIRPPSLFRKRVLSTSIYFRDAAKSNYLFHPSDIFHFGLLSDLLDLWNAPLVQSHRSAASRLALVPEQYIWIQYLLSKGFSEAKLDARRFRYASILMSEWSLATNWWVVDGKANGIVLPDRFLTTNLPEKTHFENEWRSFADRARSTPTLRACRWNVVRKFLRKVKWP